MLRGVIFDADGTLLDSMPIWHDVSRRYLTKRGLDVPDSLVEEIFTMTLEEGCRYIKALYNLDDDVETIIDAITDEIRGFYYYEAPLKPGVRELLCELRERGIPMVIATAGLRETLVGALTRLGVIDFFDELFFCAELSTSKREPLIYELAAEHLGALPSEICVFEDAAYAVKTAKKAGFYVVGVTDDSQTERDREEIERTADVFVDDVSDAADMIGNI